MASFHKSICIFFPVFFYLLCFSSAYTFNVGGKDGWTLHPSENYNQWSSRLRFIVNDILHFKYNSGSDSVLEVSKGDYDSCNTNSPITTLTGGDSVFNLNRPGPFYFISGNKSNCDQGQKLTVVVISPRKTKKAPPAGAPAPAKSTMSPVSSPPGTGMPGSTSPASSPGGGGIASSPTGNPAASPGGMGSASPTGVPVAPPGGGVSVSPAGVPVASPGGGGVSGSPAGGPAASPGGGGVSGSPAGAPAASPGGGGVSGSPAGGPAASPGGGGISGSPAGGPATSPSGGGISGSPAGAPGGGISASPTGNPSDVNAPAPTGSPAGTMRPAVCATLTVPVAMILFVVGWVY